MSRADAGGVRHRPAFSLIELVLVVFLLALLAAMAAPRYASSLNCYRADLAARRVAADLAMARNNAWAGSAHRTATFDVAANSYALAGIRGLDRATSDYSVALGDEPYCAQIVSADFEGGSAVTFDGYGMPDRGGQVVVRAGPVQRTVVLDRPSGNVSVP